MRKTSLKIQMLAGNSFISRPDSDSQKKLPLVSFHKRNSKRFLKPLSYSSPLALLLIGLDLAGKFKLQMEK